MMGEAEGVESPWMEVEGPCLEEEEEEEEAVVVLEELRRKEEMEERVVHQTTEAGEEEVVVHQMKVVEGENSCPSTLVGVEEEEAEEGLR